MIVVDEDERNTTMTSTCFNCGRSAQGRHIEHVSWIGGASRGWVFICFQCFAPRIHWHVSRSGRRWQSPAS